MGNTLQLCCTDPDAEAHLETHPGAKDLTDMSNLKVSRPEPEVQSSPKTDTSSMVGIDETY